MFILDSKLLLRINFEYQEALNYGILKIVFILSFLMKYILTLCYYFVECDMMVLINKFYNLFVGYDTRLFKIKF